MDGTALRDQAARCLTRMGVDSASFGAPDGIRVTSPIDGSQLGMVETTSLAAAERALGDAAAAFETWRSTPAPVRGELIRLLGDELRTHKEALGELVSLEVGKIRSEGLGEVQEMIDICDFAVGLSRQLYGKTIASERPGHRMMETWHPMGTCGVITAFNFPVAVWAWNAALALTCGNPVVWKPSEKSPLTALACAALFERAVARHGEAPAGLLHVLQGGAELGELLAASPQVAIVSATGSTRMGRAVAPVVASRFGRLILELGGNNAMVVAPSADLDLALRAICFSAVGTAGQRCTTLRRLIVHTSVADDLVARVKRAYGSLPVGNPLEAGTLVGPLIDEGSLDGMQSALAAARAAGGTVMGGERVRPAGCEVGSYAAPALVEMPGQTEIVQQETFAPILYVMTYSELEDAIALNNGVNQGLSSCIFTTDLREAERFVSAAGSDCGIANVNIGPSGAEIGGAFGGEKETGGGRESGSDAWKGYMRRATNTVNYSTELPLAQVHVAPALLAPTASDAVPRGVVAQAMNLVLLARSMSEVPDLARYVDEKVASGERFVLDHGAVRAVMNTSTGALPSGQRAFTRLLEPLGYVEADPYPLPALRMMGHGWRHRDLPEDIAQYFVSELDVPAFSEAFQAAVGRVVGASRDPLSAASEARLEQLADTGTLPLAVVPDLVANLVTCFARQHGPPAWSDYETLRAESAEMAWIATEGNTFNHATDRVTDVVAVAAAQRALGRRIKAEVEVSRAGTVRQTAFEAVTVWREFRLTDGSVQQRAVPGSFFEMITRDPHPDGGGLDLRFDSSNAQGIFAMTRHSES